MTQSYFQLNEDNYTNLVEQLLAETAAIKPSSDILLIDARRHFIVASIAKAAPLAEMPKNIAGLSIANLKKQADALPDKGSNGWVGVTAISEENRKVFADSADRRSPEMHWDNLFPDGKNEIYLPLSTTARSLDDKVDQFIENHNTLAASRFAAAQRLDKELLAKNPKAFPKAGNLDDQKQIRRDPENPTKMLQTWHPGKANPAWSPPQSIEKFLQKQFEWGIYDDLQKEGQSKDKAEPLITVTGKSDFRDIANREQVATDPLLDNDSLMIVVSRDPQKIGEMSTGQRWRSCMAADGINFGFVPNDIQAGSLVAYVVEKSDPDARYPLMRQLIKPFRNEAGVTILAPARIYGGMENTNSRTRDALQTALNEFVKKQNDGKSGEFTMDPSLYGDGQSPVARLEGNWTQDGIFNALKTYQESAITEWRVELRRAKERLLDGLVGPYGQTPIEAMTELQSKIRRVLTVDDLAEGLPRMFYREMRKTSIGSLPEPRQIAATSSKYIDERSVAYDAIAKMDLARIKSLTDTVSLDVLANAALLAAITAKSGTESEGFSARMWGDLQESLNETAGSEIDYERTYAAVRRAEAYREGAIIAVENSELDRISREGFIAVAEETEPLSTRVDWYANVAKQKFYNTALRQISLENFKRTVETMETAEERVWAYNLLITRHTIDLTGEAVVGLLNNVDELIDTRQRAETYLGLSRLVQPDSAEETQVTDAFAALTKNLEPRDRLQLYVTSLNSSFRSPKILKISIPRVLQDNHYETDVVERCKNYREVLRVVEKGTPDHLSCLTGILNNAHAISDVDQRIRNYYDVVIEDAPRDGQIYQRALDCKLDSIGSLPNGIDRVRQSINLSYHVEDTAQQEKILSYAALQCKDIPAIDALDQYRYIISRLNANSSLAPQVTVAALDIISGLDDPAERIKHYTHFPMVRYDVDLTRILHQRQMQAADLLDDPVAQFAVYKSVGGWFPEETPEKTLAITKMLECADKLDCFEPYYTTTLYTSGEQHTQATNGALRCIAENAEGKSNEEQVELYLKVLPHGVEGTPFKMAALERLLSLQDTLPTTEQLKHFSALTRAASKQSCLFTAGLAGQMRMIGKVSDAATRIDALSTLRVDICNGSSYTIDEKAFGPLMIETSDMLLEAVTALPTPRERVDAAKSFVKGEYSWMFDKNGEFHREEIKRRTIAERIVRADGAWPLPAHRTGSRLMSFLDRDDVSHIMYRAAETMEGALQGLSALCQIVKPAIPEKAPEQLEKNYSADKDAGVFSPVRQMGMQSR